MKKVGLTPKQELFAREYLVDLNATQAAVRSGYSAKTAEVQGCRLLRNAQVKRAVEAARQLRENKAIMAREEILKELSLIGRSDVADYMTIDEGGAIKHKPFGEMPEGASRALESIEENRTIRESSDGKDSNIVNDKVKFKLHDKLRALELLGKNIGLFPTKVEGEVTLRGRLSITDMRKSAKAIEDATPSA